METLWEHEPTGECLHSFFKFSQTFTSVSTIGLVTVFDAKRSEITVFVNFPKLNFTHFVNRNVKWVEDG